MATDLPRNVHSENSPENGSASAKLSKPTVTPEAVIKNDAASKAAGPNPSALSDSPLQNLKNLDSEPAWRGCIDSFADWSMRGWAISTTNVMSSVGLEVYICDVLVTTTTSRYNREDIAKIVGLPIKAGFQVSAQSIGTDAAGQIFEALKKLSGNMQYLSDIIKIKIRDTDIFLPFTSKFRREQVDISGLIPMLDKIVGTRVRNQYISVRDMLLTPVSSPLEENAGAIKPIAFYLPQFHPFAENNEWWGEGFTEWTNVVGAKPFYEGHHQPHVPADFGYYDLRLGEVQKSQIEMAKRYGLAGFCYYYYSFSGKTLMTLPIDRHVDEDYDFDFCLCWANENWSRRWDGSENDVLLAQRHSEEDDNQFIHSCIKYFKSPRYIKIDGAPLLLVYRVSLLQSPTETIAKWREIVKEAGFPDLHVSMVESFGLNDPHVYGCNSGCQFPPHGVVAPRVNEKIKDLSSDYNGIVYSYEEVVRSEIARPAASYTQFRCAMPSWDNTSRKGKNGNIFTGSSPELFQTWLTYLFNEARKNLPAEQRYVFINAWNEWAEGAHLEPDRMNGHKFLTSVRNALSHDQGVMGALDLVHDDTDIGLVKAGQVKVLLEKLWNSNHQLQKMIKNYEGSVSDRASPLILINPEWVNVERPVAGERVWLDNINGRVGHSTRMTFLSLHQNLSLRGWINAPDAVLLQGLPIFLGLQCSDRPNLRYMAAIYEREAREDIVASLGLTEKSLWCGFSIRAELGSIVPGTYSVSLLLSTPDDVKRLLQVEAFLDVIVA